MLCCTRDTSFASEQASLIFRPFPQKHQFLLSRFDSKISLWVALAALGEGGLEQVDDGDGTDGRG